MSEITPEEAKFLAALKAEYAKSPELKEIKSKIIQAMGKKIEEEDAPLVEGLEKVVMHTFAQHSNDKDLRAAFAAMEKNMNNPKATEEQLNGAIDTFLTHLLEHDEELAKLGVSLTEEGTLSKIARKEGLLNREDMEARIEALEKENEEMEAKIKAQEKANKVNPMKEAISELQKTTGLLEKDITRVDGKEIDLSLRTNFGLLKIGADTPMILTENYIVVGDAIKHPELSKTIRDEMRAVLKDGISPTEGKKLIEARKLVADSAKSGDIDPEEAQQITAAFKAVADKTR